MPRPMKPCWLDVPFRNSPTFAGRFINLSAVARVTGLGRLRIYYIVIGQKHGTMDAVQKIAAALGMGVEEFLLAVDQKREQLARHDEEVVENYIDRRRIERQQDNRRRILGKPVLPRLPALRLPGEKP